LDDRFIKDHNTIGILRGEIKWRSREGRADTVDKVDKADSEETLDQGKCIKQLVLSAEKNVKFLSSPAEIGPCTAETAS
jgi:hypothetical protein